MPEQKIKPLDINIKLSDQYENQIWTQKFKINLDKTKNRTRTIIKFDRLEIPNKAGLCWLSLEQKEEKKYIKIIDLPLEIKIMK